jgi:cyanophycin synthetase
MSRLEEIHGEFLAIDAALDALEPGDLCLVLIDQVEEALAHIARRIEPRGDEVDTIPAKEGIVRAHAYP